MVRLGIEYWTKKWGNKQKRKGNIFETTTLSPLDRNIIVKSGMKIHYFPIVGGTKLECLLPNESLTCSYLRQQSLNVVIHTNAITKELSWYILANFWGIKDEMDELLWWTKALYQIVWMQRGYNKKGLLLTKQGSIHWSGYAVK